MRRKLTLRFIQTTIGRKKPWKTLSVRLRSLFSSSATWIASTSYTRCTHPAVTASLPLPINRFLSHSPRLSIVIHSAGVRLDWTLQKINILSLALTTAVGSKHFILPRQTQLREKRAVASHSQIHSLATGANICSECGHPAAGICRKVNYYSRTHCESSMERTWNAISGWRALNWRITIRHLHFY